MQGMAQNKVAGAQKQYVAEAGRHYDNYANASEADFNAERGRQNAAFDKNQGTVADTLAAYSMPSQQKALDDATAKRQTSYTAPLQTMDFVAPVAKDGNTNFAVLDRNAKTGQAAKSQSIAQALAKASLDAYGDGRIVTSAKGANNAQNIAITAQGANRSQRAASVKQQGLDRINDARQGILPMQMEAAKGKGHTLGTIGDLFTTAGMMAGMSNGFGLGGAASKVGVITAGGKNAAGFLGGGMTPNIGGTGLTY